jgi:hypothetical protein
MEGLGRFHLLRNRARRNGPAGQSAIGTHLESHISPWFSFLAIGSQPHLCPLQVAFPRSLWISLKTGVRTENAPNSKRDQ